MLPTVLCAEAVWETSSLRVSLVCQPYIFHIFSYNLACQARLVGVFIPLLTDSLNHVIVKVINIAWFKTTSGWKHCNVPASYTELIWPKLLSYLFQSVTVQLKKSFTANSCFTLFCCYLYLKKCFRRNTVYLHITRQHSRIYLFRVSHNCDCYTWQLQLVVPYLIILHQSAPVVTLCAPSLVCLDMLNQCYTWAVKSYCAHIHVQYTHPFCKGFMYWFLEVYLRFKQVISSKWGQVLWNSMHFLSVFFFFVCFILLLFEVFDR